MVSIRTDDFGRLGEKFLCEGVETFKASEQLSGVVDKLCIHRDGGKRRADDLWIFRIAIESVDRHEPVTHQSYCDDGSRVPSQWAIVPEEAKLLFGPRAMSVAFVFGVLVWVHGSVTNLSM